MNVCWHSSEERMEKGDVTVASFIERRRAGWVEGVAVLVGSQIVIGTAI